jgi:glycosyltransferase involved in cell wall biosynthesis
LSKKILHISASYKPAYVYGGPIYSVSALCETLSSLSDYEVTVYTTGANGKEELAVEYNTATNVDNVKVYYFKRETKDHSQLSPKLLKKLWSTASSFDVIHIHAWWNLVSILSCVIAVLKNKKFILSPRGTLSAYTFNSNSGKIKKFFHLTAGKWLLEKGHFIVSSANEKEEIMGLISPKSINIIYNILSFLPELNQKKYSNEPEFLKLLFLSRIEKKKGLSILFKALANCNFKYHLTIVGEGDKNYVKELQEQVVDLGIGENIQWAGPVYGKEKDNFFLTHDLLVLTSFNENFANVIIESLLSATPVLVTWEVGLADYVKQKNLGWVCEANKESIVRALKQINKQRNDIIEKSERAPAIVKEDFDKKKLLSEYCDIYKKVIGSSN